MQMRRLTLVLDSVVSPLQFLKLTVATGLLIAFTYSPPTFADSYTVNASVPYPVPTQPAVLEPNLGGSTAHEALVTVSGTCQQLQPQTVVTVWRSGIALGSAACNGSFSLQIMLVLGQNVLVARTSTTAGVYGPDSTPFTINLELSDKTATYTAGYATNRAEPTTIQEKAKATNAAAYSGFAVSLGEPFSVLSSSNLSNIAFILTGGFKPYTVGVNWGDGRVEDHSLAEAGTYHYIGQYIKPGTYVIRGWARDSHGAYAEFSYAAVSNIVKETVSKGLQAGASGSVGTTSRWLGLPPVAIAGIGGTGAALIATYAGFRVGLTNRLATRSAARTRSRSVSTGGRPTAAKTNRGARKQKGRSR